MGSRGSSTTAMKRRRSSKEVARDKAISLLSRMKCYEDWLATAGDARLTAAARLSGETRAFYNATIDSLLQLVGPGAALPPHLKQKEVDG
jgi:hypothetical protein